MHALNIFAGASALKRIQKNGLSPEHVGVMPGAAGGPKGLILGAIDRFMFGHWLPQSQQRIDLIGASIGAWRMSSACLTDPVAALKRLEHDYIHQNYEHEGGKWPTAAQISRGFRAGLNATYGGRMGEILQHPRYALHVVTSRGLGLLSREAKLRTPLGYAAAFASNLVSRPLMGAWLERVVFSSQGQALPFSSHDYRTQQASLNESNFMDAVQASCSIPFVMQAVHDIADAPPGAYWDGGITDYHLHLDYRSQSGLVLYPHFQRAVIPGWLDKTLKWRHRPSAFLDNMVLLAPKPEWVKTLPNGKLPDRNDFKHYGTDLAARVAAWTSATSASERLAHEFAEFCERPNPAVLQAL
jgi:hypothetical protein